MAFSRNKLVFSIGALGFFIGSVGYFIFDWFVANNLLVGTSVPIYEFLFSPWFLSGIAGSVLSILVMFMLARFSS